MSSRAAPLSDYPTLRLGAGQAPGRERRFVHRLHRMLRADCYMVPAHGRFTTLTESAVLAFQARHGLAVIDGEVGPETWTRLHAVTEGIATEGIASGPPDADDQAPTGN